MTANYALCGETQRKEMDVINKCWMELSAMDTAARYRVINWLKSWANAEAPKDDREDFSF